MEKKWRTIQPAHKSDKITVKQAMKAWRTVEGKNGSKGAAMSTSKQEASRRGEAVAVRRK
ncbi:MAG: hypothetical protein KY467_05040 [Gemmatimonadetes bacterium]|nr:hypothetical protein [Gemmatimonadota bacterium]